jgi:hypothetical protein
MAEASVVTKIEDKKNTAVAKPMHVLISGRVEGSKSHEGKRYTQIITPAADAYSRPQMVEVRSKSRFGEKGEEVSITCTLGGYQRKPYQAKDKNTGEIVTVVPIDHTLDLVEGDN